MGITLKDVADFAGVSMSTVSRVINQKGNISEETTQKVEQAIAQLMYKPSQTTELLHRQSYHIAVFAPGNPNLELDGFHIAIDVSAVVAEIEKCGHIPYVTTLRFPNETSQNNIFGRIKNGEIDGVIICDSCDNDETKKLCLENNVPFVNTNGIGLLPQESYVDYDNADGAYQVIKYLNSLGHKKIGIISGPDYHEVTKNRLYGVYRAIEDLKLNEDDFKTVFTSYTIEGGAEATKELISNHDITAIFAFSDRLAISAMTTLRSMNLRIPQDISLVGFDDMEICRCVEPPLTSVKRYTSDITPIIVRSLLDLIDNRNIKKVQILYGTQLVPRGSTAPLKKAKEASVK